jgi:membrane protein YqaA with SNARE-associated domain
MGKRQPHGANLLPARRDAVEDSAGDDEMTPGIIVAEREPESVIVHRGHAARGTGDPRGNRGDRPGLPPVRRYNHLLILMGKFVDRLRLLALAWGAPGLFAIAFLDSSVLPLPGITDVLLILLITRYKVHAVPYVVAAVVGSVTGCIVTHAIGRKGGEALVRRQFTGSRTERATELLRQYGVMSVLIPSLLPPPAPFKIFILLAGVVGITTLRLAMAIAIGRGIRYAALGYLAYRYGGTAADYLAEHGAEASLILVGVVAAGFAGFLIWRKALGTKNR